VLRGRAGIRLSSALEDRSADGHEEEQGDQDRGVSVRCDGLWTAIFA
jgi:hypothetical protein